MSRTITLLILFWNVVLSILVGYLFTRVSTPVQHVQIEEQPLTAPLEGFPAPVSVGDTLNVPDARIAYFSMDSVTQGFTLVKESADRVRAEGRRLEAELTKEMQRAQTRAQELASKDHTYSTQAELQADQQEYQRLEQRMQELRMTSQDKIDELQVRMLTEIGKEVEEFLKDYNDRAGFDYIFSIQEGGQIWVGNKELDITAEVVSGLNARQSTRKAGK